jgi:hypothetical protein
VQYRGLLSRVHYAHFTAHGMHCNCACDHVEPSGQTIQSGKLSILVACKEQAVQKLFCPIQLLHYISQTVLISRFLYKHFLNFGMN